MTTHCVNGLYLYGIADCNEVKSLGPIGLGNPPAEVEMLTYRDVAAIVSEAREEVYVPEREDVLAHQRVLEKVMQASTVLPMSFGNVAGSKEDVLNLLKTYYTDLRSELERLRNLIEVGLKVFWEKEAVIKEIEEQTGSLEALRSPADTYKKSYQSAVKRGQLVQQTVERWIELYCPVIMERLNTLCVESKINEPIGIQMILNAAFLIATERRNEFEKEVASLDKDYQGRLSFRYVVPVPPYNFVNLRLQDPVGEKNE